jgi:hypothetical protein
VGGAVALVVAYRRQRDLEQGRFIERFGSAAKQLGDADPAVRIAGVYAMASAADEAGKFGRRQQCIDVLCGYLRLPYEPELGESHHTEIVTTARPPETSVLQTGRETTLHQKIRQNDREVRQTIVRVISARVETYADVKWSKHNYDFTGVYFEDAPFMFAEFLGDATLFDKATFSGERTNFSNAKFAGYTTSFTRAKFQNNSTFSWAEFSGRNVRFWDTTFSGRDTDFSHADRAHRKSSGVLAEIPHL